MNSLTEKFCYSSGRANDTGDTRSMTCYFFFGIHTHTVYCNEMAKSRGLRSIALFTCEGAALLSQPLHISAGQWRGEERVKEEEGERGELSRIRQPASSELFCHSCQATLANREEQVIHYRLDWHRYNLKRKLKVQHTVDQEEFERVAGMTRSSQLLFF